MVGLKSALLAAVALLAVVAASDPTAPRAPVCAINGSDGAPVSTVYKSIPILSGSGLTSFVQSVSVASPYFIITFDFSVGSFTPVAGDTVIQYAFFEEQDNSTTWANGPANACNPSDNGLYFFVLWGRTTPGSTLPQGTTITFNGLSVTIKQPMLAKQTPWWGLQVPIDSFCQHNKPGGARLGSRVYENSTVSRTGVAPCVEDSHPLDSLLPFTFICDCTPKPPGQGGGDIPPPDRSRQPPPAPSFVPPCGINGSDGVITNTLYGSAPITESGTYQGDASVSITLNGSTFIIVVDFTPTGYFPVIGSTVFQYYFFESAANVSAWAANTTNGAYVCNPAHDGLFFYVKWGTTSSSTLPVGTTITYDGSVATIVQPILTDKVVFWGGDNTLEDLCLHNKPGGAALAYRTYIKQGTVDIDANYPGTYPNCTGLLSGGPNDIIPFTFDCECPSNPGGSAPPPKRRAAPPPISCPNPTSTSPPCKFDTDTGITTSVSQSFPIIGGGSVTVTLSLPGFTTANPAFTVSITFAGFTPTENITYIQYRFFEGYNTPAGSPPGFTGGFNVQLAGKGSNCNPGDDSLLYTIKQGNNTVQGYKDSKPDITFTSTGLTFLAPIRDSSFGPWNLNSVDIKSLCCHQKDGGTVFGFRIFNKPTSTGKAPCPEDLVALNVGNFNFLMDCTCPGPARKLLA